MEKIYIETVRLLLETAPHIFRAGCFAMKGGTALNLFVHEMPRLSVDIDLVYVDHAKERDDALAEISGALVASREELVQLGLEVRLVATKAGEETKLLVRRNNLIVKIEVNHVFRGTLLPVERRDLAPTARGSFTLPVSLPILATPELYGGKLVAALDRQHPRDLFDLSEIYRRSGLTPVTVDCFVCYLAGHNRPIHEVLFSPDKNSAALFDGEFLGMTAAPVSSEELLNARERLRRDLTTALTDSHKCFLLSMAKAKPEWNLLPFPHLREMPAVRWKLLNMTKLMCTNPAKFAQQAEELQRGFERG